MSKKPKLPPGVTLARHTGPIAGELIVNKKPKPATAYERLARECVQQAQTIRHSGKPNQAAPLLIDCAAQLRRSDPAIRRAAKEAFWLGREYQNNAQYGKYTEIANAEKVLKSKYGIKL